MTPSKLRRTAVVAVDSVLAVSAGAVAGLFSAGGVAGATAPSPGWTGLQVPAPSGLNAPAGTADETVQTDGCASAVSCVAAGQYEDGSGNFQGLLSSLTRGTWSSVEATLPGDAGTDPEPQFFSTACPADGSCEVVGNYKNTDNPRSEGLIESWAGGVWNATEAPTPPDAVPEANADTWLKSVSCPAPGECTAVGYYAASVGHRTGLIETLSSGHWTPAVAPQVSDADGDQFVKLAGVSCPSMGSCVAEGTYVTNAGGQGIEVLTEAGGVWTPAVAPLPSDTKTGSSQFANVSILEDGFGQSLSCAAATQCEVAGFYATSTGDAPLLIHLSGGTLTGTSPPLPGNADTSNEDATLNAVSCGFDGGCVAVGGYDDASTAFHPLAVTISPSGAASGQEAPQPSDVAAHPDATLVSVSCLSSTDCTAVGNYANNVSSNQIGLIDTLSGTSWTAQPAAVPQNAASGANAANEFFVVNCSGRGACLAGGNYSDPNQFGLLDMYTPPEGYWLDAADGGVFAFPNAMFHGSMGGQHLNAPIVGMAPTPGDGGYWLVAADGGVFTFGNATFYGSAGAIHLNKPIVGMAATPDGRGYWLVASDGGVFNYGDAGFYGSAGAIHLNKPIVGMAPTASGLGYWLVASDGGIFTYGDGVFYGSTGDITLNKPVVGLAANVTGNGYWLVASDGGIFSFGDALFHGSAGAIKLNKPVVGMMPTFDGGGYWLIATDGGIFSYGDTSFQGSTGNLTLVSPVVGGAPT